MDWQLLKNIGYTVYECEDWRDYKRYYSFLVRAFINKRCMEQHVSFFLSTSERHALMKNCPYFIDQAVRKVFFKNSTCWERAAMIQMHITYMEQFFSSSLMKHIYITGGRILLWQDEFENKPFILYLNFAEGQHKEGCISIELVWDNEDEWHTGWDYGERIYQLIFTLTDSTIPLIGASSSNNLDTPCILVVALQGPVPHRVGDIIKRLTKKYFGYRPKNLILWCLRCFAMTIGVNNITAVTNQGYYAMNHLRLDRKLKVNLNQFWQESGGMPCADNRFYTLPVNEHRKTMNELKPSKRANHRRRYELMNAIQKSITQNLSLYMLNSLNKRK